MQHITRDQMISLLEGAQVYDHRNIDKPMVDSWLLSSQIASWRVEAVAAAIATHYATSTERIMPGHVTGYMRADRQRRPSMDELRSNPKALGAPTSPPASEATRAAALAAVRAKLEAQDVVPHRPRRFRPARPQTDQAPIRAEREPAAFGDLLGTLTRKSPRSSASGAAGRAQPTPRGASS